ncbi:MAG: M20/M25/M40 family metallo-hydrolase, partial [Planctomycetota bacterium]
AREGVAGFDPRDVMRHVDFLCRKELAGRMTGSKGEKKATAYVAAYLDYLGLVPAGDDGTWFQSFTFPDGAVLGESNTISIVDSDREFKVDQDWRPLTFSANTTIPPTDVAFAGYGIVAPEKDGFEAYDSYADLDVKDKWVLVFRFVPEDLEGKSRRHFQFYGSLRKKVFYARQRGAKGLIVVSGPSSQVRNQLVPLQNDFSPSSSSVAAVSISDRFAETIFEMAGKNLRQLQKQFDDGQPHPGIVLPNVKISAQVDVEKVVGKGRNVVGRLLAGETRSAESVIVGAHIDHLGRGTTGGSLARNEEKQMIHFGADDNASGVAAMLEIAEYLSNLKKSGKLTMKRDIVFAGWSGEELGLHGSKHYVKSVTPKEKVISAHDFVIGVTAENKVLLNGEPADLKEMQESLTFIGKSFPDFGIQIVSHPESDWDKTSEMIAMVNSSGVQDLTVIKANPKGANKTGIVAALNMDMVGRLEDKLVLQGISSSSYWSGVIESKNAVVGLPLTLSNETELPTDASSFYRAGVPILSAFTGSHTDYHTPRDTPEKLNYPDAARIARLMGLVTRDLVLRDKAPDYIKQAAQPKTARVGGGQRAYLGTVPSYGDDVVGVLLSDVTKGAPADLAGVRGGDLIVGLNEMTIEGIYDYTAAIDSVKIGKETTIVVMRNNKRLELKIVPGSRQ